MNREDEVALFTEELWANIGALVVGSRLTAEDVLQAWEIIGGRLERWRMRELTAGEGDSAERSGSTEGSWRC